MRLAAELVAARLKAGRTRGQVARRLGVSKETVAGWEHGDTSPPARKMEAIAEAYGVGLEFEWLLDVDTDVDGSTRLPRLPSGNKSCVYFIEATGLDAIKIGVSSEPLRRLWELQDASPVDLKIVGWVSGIRKHEAAIHRLMVDSHIKGEWFTASGPVRQFIKKLAAMSPIEAALYVNGLITEAA